jgi:hypothetical protein
LVRSDEQLTARLLAAADPLCEGRIGFVILRYHVVRRGLATRLPTGKSGSEDVRE